MRLKRIKLAGFKSFVDPTSIPFPEDMTAVVGPNGCGKSNVIDAVRWVLGESSAKNLRGDAMTDVIFNGSSARKPVSQCSVELVFDNSSGRIQGEFANYNELSVKRLVTRDGQSNYFLNASKCRKRDITDLFLGTGLGPRSYAIIEQGMISRLIESKPQELRVFIEEAAGVSKYKERRRETENRIRHSKENLERLEDVRAELGQQLEKLQRQAAAATRYKELKAKERQLKGELAAIRWLKHSQHVEQLHAKMAQQEADIEAFVAQQRGDEKGIIDFREKQADLKQKLTDVQQQLFELSTEITRIEQNQLHSKQRGQQIETELAQLNAALQEADVQKQQNQIKLEELTAQLEEKQPEQLMLEESLLDQQTILEQAEAALDTQQHQWQQQESQYNQLKQQVQQRHSQIQSTMDMQMRTQQRISELQREQQELKQDAISEQIDDANETLELAQQTHLEAYEQHQQAEQDLQEIEKKYTLQQENWRKLQGQQQANLAKIEALNTLLAGKSAQQPVEAVLESQSLSHQAFWQYLDVKPKWQAAMDVLCQMWQQAYVLEQVSVELMDALPAGAKVLLSDSFTQTKQPGSLAEAVDNASVPRWFNVILLAESEADARAKLASLADGQSIVTPDANWMGPDWLINGSQDAEQGLMQQANQLKQEETLQLELAEQADKQKLQLQQLQQQKSQIQADEKNLRAKENQYQQALSQAQQALQLLQFQSQQLTERHAKIEQELNSQQQLFEQEKIQIEELAEQLEMLEGELSEFEQKQLEGADNKLALQQKVNDSRQQLENLRRQEHELALQCQALKSQLQNLEHNVERDKSQLGNMLNRQQSLLEEKGTLAMPMEEQAEKLAELLQGRSEADLTREAVSDQLAEVDNLLSEAEKGQHGVMEKIQQMRAELESSKLEYEGYRVRASSIMEQLQETNQSLKPILESLPEQANEKEWQQQLEKTTNSVSRLGAVNLAAVEEFQVQAQRKKHLDEQNADLVAALETLENAIRKIDKETRSRFRYTFDKVNNDLKSLFPKVFGGGSAYLDLTDDDLLETGVTIMARPPGKKNSTIHLLSGGEKALTALSLVFAIFRLNPAPFCLLDEVDAPLDDANVGRFCKLVSEMSDSVQFIYITHNKIAMEMATHLMGVTMAEPGVSRMVAVDVEEAVAIAEA